MTQPSARFINVGMLGFFCALGVFKPFTVNAYDPINAAATPPQPGKEMTVAPYAAGVIEISNPSDQHAAAWVDPNYVTCGQACLYQKAKEALSVQIFYVEELRNRLAGWLPFEKNARAKPLIGPFCNATESGSDCAERYKLFTDFWLLKARSSLASSDQGIYALTLSQRNGDAAVTYSDGDNDVNQGKTAQSTYVMTVNDLYRLAKGPRAMQTLNQVQSNDDWIKAVTVGMDQKNPGLEPIREDFIKFKSVPRDPDDPGGAVLQIADGYDDKTYAAAKKQWEVFTGANSKKYHLGLWATLDGREGRNPNIRAAMNQERALFMTGDPSTAKNPTEPQNLQLFKESRAKFIKIVQNLNPQQTFQSARNKAGQVVNATPTYTGQEQLKSPDVNGNTATSTFTSYNPNFATPMTQSDSQQSQQGVYGSGGAGGSGQGGATDPNTATGSGNGSGKNPDDSSLDNVKDYSEPITFPD